MIFGQNRDELRQMYADAWRKHREGAVLSPLEAQIAAVVDEHPEYQATVERAGAGADYGPEGGETNPFLHMGLHLAIRDQVATDRPPGVRRIHAELTARLGSPHDAEHRMAEALAETLWEAQGRSAAPDDRLYLERLRRLA